MSYIIENITTKEVTTKFGPKPAYTITAGGERFSYGFKKPAFAIGDEVDFQYTENTYGKNVDLASVQMLKKGTGAPTPSASAASPGKAPYSPPSKVYLDSSEDIDTVQAYADLIIEIARKFEAYSCGDLDAAQAEEMIK